MKVVDLAEWKRAHKKRRLTMAIGKGRKVKLGRGRG
jgi:hypothetical protein